MDLEEPVPEDGLQELFDVQTEYTLAHLAALLHYSMSEEGVNTLIVSEEGRVDVCAALSSRDNTTRISGPSTTKAGLFGPSGLYFNSDVGHIIFDNIDEFNSSYSVLREPFEHETYTQTTGNKGHHVRDVPVNTLALTPPEYGVFDDFEPIESQIPLPKTILQSFDLLFISQSNSTIPTEVVGTTDAYLEEAVTVTPGIPSEIEAELSQLERALRANEPSAFVNACPDLQVLGKAFASIRLSETVEDVDVGRVRYILDSIGFTVGTTGARSGLIEAGGISPMRDKIRVVESALKELADDNGESGVHYERLLEVVESHGLTEGQLDLILQTLRDQGDVWKPSDNRYALF